MYRNIELNTIPGKTAVLAENIIMQQTVRNIFLNIKKIHWNYFTKKTLIYIRLLYSGILTLDIPMKKRKKKIMKEAYMTFMLMGNTLTCIT
jgi:hypothetical protein